MGTDEIDRSIRPIVLTINRLGVRTLFSCSGLLSDHVGREMGMTTPYLTLVRVSSSPIGYEGVRRALIASGFQSHSHAEYLRRDYMPTYYPVDVPDLTQNDRWYAEETDRRQRFGFFFGVETLEHDIEYSRLDEPLWQERIRVAWHELYRRVLRMLP